MSRRRGRRTDRSCGGRSAPAADGERLEGVKTARPAAWCRGAKWVSAVWRGQASWTCCGGISTFEAAAKKGLPSPSTSLSSSSRLWSPVRPSTLITTASPPVQNTSSPASGRRSLAVIHPGRASWSTSSEPRSIRRELLFIIVVPPWGVAGVRGLCLLVPVRDPPLAQVVGRDRQRDPVALQHADAELRHLPGAVRQDAVPVG